MQTLENKIRKMMTKLEIKSLAELGRRYNMGGRRRMSDIMKAESKLIELVNKMKQDLKK